MAIIRYTFDIKPSRLGDYYFIDIWCFGNNFIKEFPSFSDEVKTWLNENLNEEDYSLFLYHKARKLSICAYNDETLAAIKLRWQP